MSYGILDPFQTWWWGSSRGETCPAAWQLELSTSQSKQNQSRCPRSHISPQQPASAITTYLSRVLRSAFAMSFETTATIASFGGKLLKLSHQSSSTNTEMKLNLYLPPQALKSGAKVPVLFYLSGLTCTGDNCSEKGFFQNGASKRGIAVVYPDTSPRMLDNISCVNLFI